MAGESEGSINEKIKKQESKKVNKSLSSRPESLKVT